MKLFWISTLLIIAGNVSYHICQKSIPEAANPLVSVIVTFAIAMVVSLAFLPFSLHGDSFFVGLKDLNWASVVLGLAIIGIEVGYLLLYRSGWNISLGPVFCNAVVTLALIPIGLFLFKERLVLLNYLGIVVAFVGIYLITRR